MAKKYFPLNSDGCRTRISPRSANSATAEKQRYVLKGVELKKNTIKYLIDVTIFINLCSITIIGILLGFVIPEGKGVDKYFFGLHRHEWGSIHLYLSLFFLVLLFFHIWLNRAWIVNSTKHYFGKNWKNALWAFSGGWVVLLFIGWIVVKIS